MYVSIDLTRVPPYVNAGRNEYGDEPLWHLEIWPTQDDGSEVVGFTADSLDDLDALWQAIRDAVEARRAEERPVARARGAAGGG